MHAQGLAGISELEEQHKAFQKSLEGQEAECRRKYLEHREPLCLRREQLVNGTASPTDEELKDYSVAEDADEEGKDTRGVPFFWATVLKNQDSISEHVTQRDLIALEYLENIELVSRSGADGAEFTFRTNPYFSNKFLRRVVGWEDMGGASVPVDEGTSVDWKAGHNLTVKEVAKKSAKGGKKFKRCSSFFRFFLPAVTTVSDQSSSVADRDGVDEEITDEVVLRKFEHDEAILKAVKDQVIPKAVHIFLSGSLRTASSSGEFDGDYEVISGAISAPESLSEITKRNLHALKMGQAELDALHEDYISDILQLHLQRVQKLTEMGKKRRKLLVPAEDEDLVEQNFWLNAMRALSLGPVAIHSRDEKALSLLKDIRYQWTAIGGEERGFTETYEFEFSPNPYFENDVLRKEFQFSGTILESATARLVHEDFTDITWKAGKDLTQKQTDANKSTQSTKPAASFFGLFIRGGARLVFNIPGQGKEVDQEARDMELEFFQQIKEELLANPAKLFVEVDAEDKLNSSDNSDEDEWKQQEEEKKVVRGAVDEGRGGHGTLFTSGNILLGILLVVVLAELFIYWDHLGATNSYFT